MKLSLFENEIAWNPGTDEVALLFRRGATPRPGERTREDYCYHWKISDDDLEKLPPAEVKHLVLAQALHLIVTYHCDPHAVHQVLLELEEYVEGWANLFTYNLGYQ